MKLHLNIISLKCGKDFYDIFKKLTDEEGIEVGVSIYDDNSELQPNDHARSKLSTKSDSNSNIITWNFTKELEFSWLDNKRPCFEFQHRKKIIAQISESISILDKNFASTFRPRVMQNDRGVLYVHVRVFWRLKSEEKASKYNFFGN